MSLLSDARLLFQRRLISEGVLSLDPAGVASNSDSSNRGSIAIGRHIADQLGIDITGNKLSGQTVGSRFEREICTFLSSLFPLMRRMRPGGWKVTYTGTLRREYHLSEYEPYRHLKALAESVEENNTLLAVLGNSYSISPDVILTRSPMSDEEINAEDDLVGPDSGRLSIIRSANQSAEIVHAVISCKWTLRSDRAQNSRAEALSLIRNRKGRTPHIVVVTAEPLPSRLASLALGTGDIDMVYHVALNELVEAVDSVANQEARKMLSSLIVGERIRDIADLPLDLCI